MSLFDQKASLEQGKQVFEQLRKTFPPECPSSKHDEESLKEEVKSRALRYNEGKPKWSMVDLKAMEPMVRVLMYGENKYARDNWKKGLSKTEILDSLMRHVAALSSGEKIDEESKCEHIGHIMVNAMFYSYFEQNPDNARP